MLELKNITVKFAHNLVLKNLTAKVGPGDFIVIVGTNGVGKTTLFDTIAGKIKPSTGTIILDGVDVTDHNEIHRASAITRLFQNPRLNSVGSMTVAQNLALAKYCRRAVRLVHGMHGFNPIQAEKVLTSVGLDPKLILQRPMSSLSGGQRQLIAFMMSTQHIPRLLLLDEPTAALDPQAATKLLKLAATFTKKNKVTTLLITHDPHIALNLGNKIWIMQNGMITKEFRAEDKSHLQPEDLIGNIDYRALKN